MVTFWNKEISLASFALSAVRLAVRNVKVGLGMMAWIFTEALGRFNLL